MMLREVAYKTDLDDAEAVWDLVSRHCKDAIGTLPIVRGMNPFRNGFGILHGAAGARRSKNTTNHYTVILDEVLPKEFPRRSKSIICANWANRQYAAGYGVPHAILPYDGVAIGVCPERDIFDTEISLSRSARATARPIYRWNDFFKDNDISDESFAKLMRDFKAYLERRDMQDLSADTIEETVRRAYSRPFRLATTAEAEVYNDGEAHEVWVSGKCVAIDMMLYRSVMNGRGIRTKA